MVKLISVCNGIKKYCKINKYTAQLVLIKEDCQNLFSTQANVTWSNVTHRIHIRHGGTADKLTMTYKMDSKIYMHRSIWEKSQCAQACAKAQVYSDDWKSITKDKSSLESAFPYNIMLFYIIQTNEFPVITGPAKTQAIQLPVCKPDSCWNSWVKRSVIRPHHRVWGLMKVRSTVMFRSKETK